MAYRPRIIDGTVAHYLSIAGAVLIEGPRASGKTETGRHHSRSVVLLDVDEPARELAAISPDLVLEGAAPRLIDEWQLAPTLWNHVRRTVDDSHTPGQFILTGSAVPADDLTRHSGAGRILRLRMRTMSLLESEHSTGRASLQGLMAGEPLESSQSPLTLRDIAARLAVGGWPGLQGLGPADAQEILRSYLDDVARVDIGRAGSDSVGRDPQRIRRMLASYARHISTSASMSTIARDTAGADHGQLRHETASEYLSLLERIMVIEEQPSWSTHLRSRDTVRKASVRHFVDPSLAVAALGAGPERLLKDPHTLGLLFESLVIRDIRTYAQPLKADVFHYRDSAGAEADVIIQTRDGAWAAAEVKLNEKSVDTAAANLLSLASKVDSSRVGSPAFLMVVTAGQYCYTRPDGVHVVPLGVLGP